MRKCTLVMYCVMLIILLAGCRNNTMQVTIEDGYTRTLVEIPQGVTVSQVLEEAEIELSTKDVVIPYLEAAVDSSNSSIKIMRYAMVNVVTEEGTIAVELIGEKVEDAIADAGVELRKNDFVNHSLQAYLTDGMTVSVSHRMEVYLKIDGKKEKFLTQANTVEEFLVEKDVTLGELDRVTPALTKNLKDGTQVVVKRVEIKDVTVNEPILFETEVRYSNSMLVGTSRVTTAGVNGEKKVTYRITYVDGKEESRSVISETILAEAVNQVVVQGSKPKGKQVVSKEAVYDCDGSGHGYYIITYSDGTVEYVDF